MASVNLFRGGTPEFRPAFCCGDYPAWKPPFDATHLEGTPPYDSHADGAREQGFLTLSFPFVPVLLDTDAHRWMQEPLKGLKAVNDIVRLIWIPTRGYVDSLHIELTKYDTRLDGVYVTPVVQRAVWNFSSETFSYNNNTLFDSAMASYANATKLPLGTPAAASGSGASATPADSTYIVARFPQTDSNPTWSFGHNIAKYNAQGEPTGGADQWFGANVLGLKITAGAASKIAEIYRGTFELWISMKFLAFECPTFTG